METVHLINIETVKGHRNWGKELDPPPPTHTHTQLFFKKRV